MASSPQVSSYLSAQPKRTPKLTYRTNSNDASSATASTQPASPAFTDPGHSPRYSRSEIYSQLEGKRASSAVSMSTQSMDKTSRKKSGFFSGLFGVKEPSAQALLDYQKQMLKPDGSEVKSRPTAIGMGVSSARLPPTVPKVNSKWDGVPQIIKEREKKKQLAARQSMSFLTPSVKTEHSGSGQSNSSLGTSDSRRPASRGTLGGASVCSTGSGNRLADLYGWEITECPSSSSSRDWAAEHKRPSTSRSASSRTAPTLQRTSVFPSDVPEPPRIPDSYLGESATPPPGSPAAPDHSHSPSLTPCDSSPATPSSPSPLKNLATPSSDNKVLDNLQTTTIDVPASVDDVIIKSAGVGILAPPAAAKRRLKKATLQPDAERPKTSGTDSGPSSTHKPDDTYGHGTPSRSSRPPSSGLRRTNSARERLSLGMTLKHQAFPPWGGSELHLEAQPITNDPGTISPTPEEGSRRKRLTLFKK